MQRLDCTQSWLLRGAGLCDSRMQSLDIQPIRCYAASISVFGSAAGTGAHHGGRESERDRTGWRLCRVVQRAQLSARAASSLSVRPPRQTASLSSAHDIDLSLSLFPATPLALPARTAKSTQGPCTRSEPGMRWRQLCRLRSAHTYASSPPRMCRSS